jgi:hypothetical protein
MRKEHLMGYNIYIGEAKIYTGLEFEDNDVYVGVEEIEIDEAPYWEGGDISDKTNGRHPSYTGFSRFINEAGLKDLFRDESYGLIRGHPGVYVLQEDDYKTVRNARIKWENDHPNAEAGWGEDKDHVLARLIWFEFWFKWTLVNCKVPVIKNG